MMMQGFYGFVCNLQQPTSSMQVDRKVSVAAEEQAEAEVKV